MRNKMVEEVNRVVRESRTKPNETLYDFLNSSQAAQTCKAFKDTTEAAPGDLSWTELPNAQYQQLWYSDDDRCQVDCVESGKCAVLLFRFKIDSRENTVKKLVLAFEGYGAAPSGNGITLKVYNHNEENWQNTQVGAVSGNDETITLTLLSNIADYITDAGYVWFLARTSNASNGILPATIFCNYVSCLAAVNGITYCDLVSYRNLDRLDVKPFILNTELVLKSWFFENIGV